MTRLDPAYRLARDGRHAYLGDTGAFIGAGVPLLEKDEAGRWRPRPRAVLERLFSIGHDRSVDLEWRMAKLASVARALNVGDRSMAAIALVQTELTPLPDIASAHRMARANGLIKDFDPNEPRDARGRWTTEGADASSGKP